MHVGACVRMCARARMCVFALVYVFVRVRASGRIMHLCAF